MQRVTGIVTTQAAEKTVDDQAFASGLRAAGIGPEDFLTLLVAEMRQQDPFDPLDARQMVAQLAQLESLSQLQQINKTLGSQQSEGGLGPGGAEALRLLGHQVTWIDTEGQVHQGRVSQVQRSQSSWVLEVGEQRLDPGQVLGVKE